MTILDRLVARRLLELPLASTHAAIASTLLLEGEGEARDSSHEWCVEWTEPFASWEERIVLTTEGDAIHVNHMLQTPDPQLWDPGVEPRPDALVQDAVKAWKAHVKKLFKSTPTKAGGTRVTFSAPGRPSMTIGSYNEVSMGGMGGRAILQTQLRVEQGG